MMKKTIVCVMIASLLVAMSPVFAGGSKETSEVKKVVLTMGSWRADDVTQVTNLLKEYQKLNPNVEIQFKPTNPPEYNATLRLQLDSGTGPDLMYARSYAPGQELFNVGYFADVSNFKGLKQNFTASNLAPWTMPDGKIFAVPFAAVSHGFFYNKDLFAKAGVTVPNTWEEFLTVCETLLKAGITPIGNGVAEEWDINECFMMGILPSFTGASAGRLEYESGKRKLNDADMVSAYQAMADIAKYLPKGFEAITYNDSAALFATGKVAMYIDGSWSLGMFADVPFQWGVFAAPAPAGKKTAITFHPDMAITMNTKTKHPAETQAFLEWLCTVEGASTASKYLPLGFYPMINARITIENKQANEMLELNRGKETDARFVWPKFMAKEPSGYVLMNQGVINVLKGIQTPQQAADDLAKGVATWYKP